jgi:hypothetical protein
MHVVWVCDRCGIMAGCMQSCTVAATHANNPLSLLLLPPIIMIQERCFDVVLTYQCAA